MKRSLVVADELRGLIRHLPPILKGRIKQALVEIVADPSVGKSLRDELSGLHSYRIGNIRVVYRVEPHAVALITIGPRKTVYQKVVLELKRQASGR